MRCTCGISDFGDLLYKNPDCPEHAAEYEKESENRKNSKMSDKEVLYYTLKYGDRYYAPYLHNDSRKMIESIESMLTDKKYLAVRFGTKEIAEYFRDQEVMNRTLLGEEGFDPEQVRVVTVTKKTRHIH